MKVFNNGIVGFSPSYREYFETEITHMKARSSGLRQDAESFDVQGAHCTDVNEFLNLFHINRSSCGFDVVKTRELKHGMAKIFL